MKAKKSTHTHSAPELEAACDFLTFLIEDAKKEVMKNEKEKN